MRLTYHYQGAWEKIEDWRQLAREARDLLQAAVEVGKGRIPTAPAWEALCPWETQTPEERADVLRQHANRWLRIADVRPVLTRDGLVFGGGLAGALAVQLAEEMEDLLSA